MKRKQEETELNQVIYVGPSLPNGLLTQYALFLGGTPEYLTDFLEKHEAVRELIVPVSELSSVQQAIATRGTHEYELYQSILRGD